MGEHGIFLGMCPCKRKEGTSIIQWRVIERIWHVLPHCCFSQFCTEVGASFAWIAYLHL